MVIYVNFIIAGFCAFSRNLRPNPVPGLSYGQMITTDLKMAWVADNVEVVIISSCNKELASLDYNSLTVKQPYTS